MTTKAELKIFNVKHGFCGALLSPNSLILLDCGHDSQGTRPLAWLYDEGYRHIDCLIISNFDQDHISDILAIKDYFTVGSLAINPTVSSQTLRQLKLQNGPISNQMEILINSMENPELNSVSKIPHKVNDIDLAFYCAYYPYETDTNNLSLVTFIQFGTSYIIYPGDLERSGWLKLLAVPDFVDHLRKVNVFIASHHGRINGYCEEVFEYCRPEIVIISDQERQYSTQEHDRYSRHAIGVNFGTILNPEIRRVMTTRRDGNLTLHKIGENTFVKAGL